MDLDEGKTRVVAGAVRSDRPQAVLRRGGVPAGSAAKGHPQHEGGEGQQHAAPAEIHVDSQRMDLVDLPVGDQAEDGQDQAQDHEHSADGITNIEHEASHLPEDDVQGNRDGHHEDGQVSGFGVPGQVIVAGEARRERVDQPAQFLVRFLPRASQRDRRS